MSVSWDHADIIHYCFTKYLAIVRYVSTPCMLKLSGSVYVYPCVSLVETVLYLYIAKIGYFKMFMI